MRRSTLVLIAAAMLIANTALAPPRLYAQEPSQAHQQQAAATPAQTRDTQADNQSQVGLTIYSSADPAGFNPQKFISQQRSGYTPNYVRQVPGFGVVRESRSIKLQKGVNTINFVNVARFIDPTTVSFTDLASAAARRSSPPVSVLKQTFLFDLVSPAKLLDNYLGRKIGLRVPTDKGFEKVTGKLLSHVGDRLVLQTDQGLRLIPSNKAQVTLGKLPGGLITRPTLRWKLDSKVSGQRRVRTSYQTAGITWRADYNLVLNQDEDQADLAAWVTILNLSGKAYDDAKLQLIAGNVHRVQPRRPRPMVGNYAARAQAAQKQGFQQKAFYEYHLYTLPRPTTIADNTTQQITLFPTAQNVNVDKVLVYYGLPADVYGLPADVDNWRFPPAPIKDHNLGNQSNHKVDAYIRFKNSEQNNLGMPLPRGKVRVYKVDQQQGPGPGTMEFLGEDRIDHTPRDEKLLIKTGQSFDIVGERKQTDFSIDAAGKTMTESIRIELRNHKKHSAHVLIKENLFRWSNWTITQKSDDFKKVNARTIHFPVTVPAEGKKVVTYTVKYTW